MPVIIGLCSQKGGVTKTSLARALAVEAARAGLVVDAVDLDYGQQTLSDWARDRAAAGHLPAVAVRVARTLTEALDGVGADADLVIIDGPAKADAETLALAQVADIVVQPTNAGLDDLRPAVRTFNGLVDRGVPRAKLLIALSRVGSPAEAAAAREYLEVAGYAVAAGHVPERVTYRTLHNSGLAITEAKADGLRGAAEVLIQSIIDAAVAASQETVA